MDKKSEVTRVRIDLDDHAWLKTFAGETERTMAAVVRLAVREFIERQQHESQAATSYEAWQKRAVKEFVEREKPPAQIAGVEN